MVCDVSQLDAVKVIVVGETVTYEFDEAMATVTLDFGFADSSSS